MFEPTRYLAWARRVHGTVRCDLATSGMPTVRVRELGFPEPSTFDDPTGWERLRGAISRYNDVPHSEAIAALGTTHALWLAYVSLTSPGDDVLVEEPAYEPLVRIAEGVGVRVLRFTREPHERFALDPRRVAQAMTPRTRVVAVTNLHNPSGARTSDDALRETAQVADAHGAHLLVDEVYAPFDSMVDASGVFASSARKLAPNVVAVSSLTKCFGLGPERIGWLLAAPDVVARSDDAITASCGMLPLAHAHVALHAFANIAALAERGRAILSGKRERVAAWVDANGWSWSAPGEGLFGFVTIPGASDLTPRIERAAHDRGVLVVPGTFFGLPGGFRIAWSAPADVLDEGLGRLAAALLP